MSLERRNRKRKAFCRWQQPEGLPGGLAHTLSRNSPHARAHTLPHPDLVSSPSIPLLVAHCLNHFLGFNSHKNVVIDYILGEGTVPSSAEDMRMIKLLILLSH